jgi:hypothetical protein
MTTPETQDSSFPGDPPRHITFKRLFACLPGNLQIMIILFPPVFVATLVWILVSPDENSCTAFGTAVVALPFYVLMILVKKRNLQHRPATVGAIKDITKGEGSFSGCEVIHYSYSVEGRVFRGEHLTSDPKGAEVGQKPWVLFNAGRPQESTLWVD